MSRSSARVRVVVLAIREVGAAIKKRSESAFSELIPEFLQVIGAKLVDDNDDD